VRDTEDVDADQRRHAARRDFIVPSSAFLEAAMLKTASNLAQF